MPRELAGLQLAQTFNLEQVNGEVSAVKHEASVRVRHVAVLFRKVTVFDHAGLAILQGENAHLFVRTGLVNHLGCRHAAAFACESANKGGVANAAERVVDAVKEYVAYALFD